MNIKLLSAIDLKNGFAECLSVLAPVELKEDKLREVFRKRLCDNILTYIAMENDRIIGTATLLIEQKFIHSGGKVGYIEDVAVLKDHQIKGIGKKLIEALVKKAKEVGCYKVILDCSDTNVGFYEKCGFRKHCNCMRKDI